MNEPVEPSSVPKIASSAVPREPPCSSPSEQEAHRERHEPGAERAQVDELERPTIRAPTATRRPGGRSGRADRRVEPSTFDADRAAVPAE